MNTIIVPHGIRNKLASLFGVSLPTVRKALEGKSVNKLALKIRRAAVENGGREVLSVDSEFTAENKWIMRMGDGIRVIADLDAGRVDTIRGGCVVKTYYDPNISQIMDIQREAIEMSVSGFRMPGHDSVAK